jgi:hypothetical protein
MTEALEVSKLLDFAFGLAGSGGVGQRFGYCFAVGFIGEPQIGAVGWLAGLMAVATGFTATAGGGGDGTGTKVAKLRDLVSDGSSPAL